VGAARAKPRLAAANVGRWSAPCIRSIPSWLPLWYGTCSVSALGTLLPSHRSPLHPRELLWMVWYADCAGVAQSLAASNSGGQTGCWPSARRAPSTNAHHLDFHNSCPFVPKVRMAPWGKGADVSQRGRSDPLLAPRTPARRPPFVCSPLSLRASSHSIERAARGPAWGGVAFGPVDGGGGAGREPSWDALSAHPLPLFARLVREHLPGTAQRSNSRAGWAPRNARWVTTDVSAGVPCAEDRPEHPHPSIRIPPSHPPAFLPLHRHSASCCSLETKRLRGLTAPFGDVIDDVHEPPCCARLRRSFERHSGPDLSCKSTAQLDCR